MFSLRQCAMFKHFWSVCSMFKYYRNFMCVVDSPIFPLFRYGHVSIRHSLVLTLEKRAATPVCSIYIAERKKRRGCFPPTGSKHYSFLRLFHPLRPGFQQDYAVAAAASSATWDACCSVQMRLRSPYTLSTRPEHGND